MRRGRIPAIRSSSPLAGSRRRLRRHRHEPPAPSASASTARTRCRVTAENVLGVLSLIIYALFIVISIRYIAIVMRADNQGEGGILALTALLRARGKAGGAMATPVLIALGIFGAALLYGDGMITPAISVLGAVEGLQVATPLFAPYVVPIVGGHPGRPLRVSAVRHPPRRTACSDPIMVVWFVTIAGLGISWIVREPSVIGAINPIHAVRYFQRARRPRHSPCSAPCSSR